MKLCTAKEIKGLDSSTINDIGISSLILMDHAGRAVSDILCKRHHDILNKKVCVICGKGNNGGDGFVAARYLHNKGIFTEIFLLSDKKAVSKDASVNLAIAQRIGITVHEVQSAAEMHKGMIEAINKADIIIDAILGVGINSGVKGFFRDVIRLINSAGKDVISIDLPSGIDSDTGKIPGEHIDANLTITLALPKIGNIIYPAAYSSGELKIVDIGIPKTLTNSSDIKRELLEDIDLSNILKKRKDDTHKGTYGHTFVLAGSRGKEGAAYMAALSAARSGAGLITLALPEGLRSAAEAGFPEIMSIPLPKTDTGSIDIKAKVVILKQIKDKDCIVIGPGLSLHKNTVKLIHSILKEDIKCPVVIDADGLNAIAANTGLIKDRPFPIIVTPHPGEMGRLANKTTQEIQDNRIDYAESFAKGHNVYVVLKGAGTIIATPEGNTYINPTGNPGMATAGSGDVLSGIIGGFLSQGFSVSDALKGSVYLHGLSGDLAAQETGEYSLMATDIIKTLPSAMKLIGAK